MLGPKRSIMGAGGGQEHRCSRKRVFDIAESALFEALCAAAEGDWAKADEIQLFIVLRNHHRALTSSLSKRTFYKKPGFKVRQWDVLVALSWATRCILAWLGGKRHRRIPNSNHGLWFRFGAVSSRAWPLQQCPPCICDIYIYICDDISIYIYIYIYLFIYLCSHWPNLPVLWKLYQQYRMGSVSGLCLNCEAFRQSGPPRSNCAGMCACNAHCKLARGAIANDDFEGSFRTLGL